MTGQPVFVATTTQKGRLLGMSSMDPTSTADMMWGFFKHQMDIRTTGVSLSVYVDRCATVMHRIAKELQAEDTTYTVTRVRDNLVEVHGFHIILTTEPVVFHHSHADPRSPANRELR